jgi:hypothetical protein|tara:strand:- start:166 stop:312 length:147 start_codon:yes stop_codon:yes gene_type:complete
MNLLHENIRNNGNTQEQVAEGKEIGSSHQSAAQQGGAWNNDNAIKQIV